MAPLSIQVILIQYSSIQSLMSHEHPINIACSLEFYWDICSAWLLALKDATRSWRQVFAIMLSSAAIDRLVHLQAAGPRIGEVGRLFFLDGSIGTPFGP